MYTHKQWLFYTLIFVYILHTHTSYVLESCIMCWKINVFCVNPSTVSYWSVWLSCHSWFCFCTGTLLLLSPRGKQEVVWGSRWGQSEGGMVLGWLLCLNLIPSSSSLCGKRQGRGPCWISAASERRYSWREWLYRAPWTLPRDESVMKSDCKLRDGRFI